MRFSIFIGLILLFSAISALGETDYNQCYEWINSHNRLSHIFKVGPNNNVEVSKGYNLDVNDGVQEVWPSSGPGEPSQLDNLKYRIHRKDGHVTRIEQVNPVESKEQFKEWISNNQDDEKGMPVGFEIDFGVRNGKCYPQSHVEKVQLDYKKSASDATTTEKIKFDFDKCLKAKSKAMKQNCKTYDLEPFYKKGARFDTRPSTPKGNRESFPGADR